MRITYVHDADTTIWDFDPDDVMAAQAELIEKRYGQPWDKWMNDLRQGSPKARRVLLWHLLRLTHHTLKYEDVPDFRMRELKVEMSYDELMKLRDRVQKMAEDDVDREKIMAALDVEITEAMVREGLTDEVAQDRAEAGKASSKKSAISTGSP